MSETKRPEEDEPACDNTPRDFSGVTEQIRKALKSNSDTKSCIAFRVAYIEDEVADKKTTPALLNKLEAWIAQGDQGGFKLLVLSDRSLDNVPDEDLYKLFWEVTAPSKLPEAPTVPVEKDGSEVNKDEATSNNKPDNSKYDNKSKVWSGVRRDSFIVIDNKLLWELGQDLERDRAGYSF